MPGHSVCLPPQSEDHRLLSLHGLDPKFDSATSYSLYVPAKLTGVYVRLENMTTCPVLDGGKGGKLSSQDGKFSGTFKVGS